MNDPDNFLSRWSRRKQEAGQGAEKENKKSETDEAVSASAPENHGKPAAAPEIPEFDVKSLPTIDSISAETDISAFMRAGVPETLKHTALRRAWSSDPTIRDFVGLNENYWDAAGPDGIAGFGDLDPNLDVKRMVSELFGETPQQQIPSEPGVDRVADSPPSPPRDTSEPVPLPAEASPPAEDVSQSNKIAAAQTEPQESAPDKKFTRRHGGAMPQQISED
jgi:hypothetical protein